MALLKIGPARKGMPLEGRVAARLQEAAAEATGCTDSLPFSGSERSAAAPRASGSACKEKRAGAKDRRWRTNRLLLAPTQSPGNNPRLCPASLPQPFRGAELHGRPLPPGILPRASAPFSSLRLRRAPHKAAGSSLKAAAPRRALPRSPGSCRGCSRASGE